MGTRGEDVVTMAMQVLCGTLCSSTGMPLEAIRSLTDA